MTDDGQNIYARGGRQCAPLPAPIAADRLGSATVHPSGPVPAGSWQTYAVTYTAGRYGIDDSGAMRLCFRFAADHTKPQFTDPKGPGYTTVKASNNAVLEYRFEQKGNVRPFDQTIYVKVVNGYMKEGDTITVTLGERSGGSPGMRVQTFVEDTFEFRVLVDPVATFTFQSLPVQPEVSIVAGPPARYLLVAPTLRGVGEPFAIGLKGEDAWGNPSDQRSGTYRIVTSRPVDGLPEQVTFRAGEAALRFDGLTVGTPGVLELSLVDADGRTVAGPQRMIVAAEAGLRPYWADFHGQSEETIGTNSAESYFAFARNKAFLDIAGHQGNDFQITGQFWAELNALTARMNRPGRFVTLPGYEWSGNTALGGDRNVFFTTEGRPIRRSSHALIADQSDLDLDVPTAGDLFTALARDGEDAICFAHCGGRYADLNVAHDGRFERSVEVHSAWGTFEWLLHDALRLGHRVGVVCNSDGHKGRPGASYPGASSFGAIGGLTCLMLPELTREAVVDCLRRRHHYGTTGGPNGRLHLTVEADVEAQRCDEDPKLGPTGRTPASHLVMGDIAETAAAEAAIRIGVTASAGIERVDLFNGLDHVATMRTYAETDLGDRIRVLWEGASYRGRFRQVIWDGTATFEEAGIRETRPINFFNPDRKLERTGPQSLAWKALTTGNFGGFDAWLDGSRKGRLAIATPLIEADLPLAEIGLDERAWSVDGPLPRRLRVFRLPDAALAPTMAATRTVALRKGRDNAIYVRVTLEDGTQAWSSPIYLIC